MELQILIVIKYAACSRERIIHSVYLGKSNNTTVWRYSGSTGSPAFKIVLKEKYKSISEIYFTASYTAGYLFLYTSLFIRVMLQFDY